VDSGSGSLHDFVAALRGERQRKTTGTYYLKVDANRAALLALRSGEIVGLRFGPLVGARALEIFGLTRHMSWRLEAGLVALVNEDLGSSRAVLATLEGGQAPEAPASDVKRFSPGQRERLLAVLTDFTGPAAGFVLDEVLARQGEPANEAGGERLVLALAEEVDGAEAEQFVARARAALGLSA